MMSWPFVFVLTCKEKVRSSAVFVHVGGLTGLTGCCFKVGECRFFIGWPKAKKKYYDHWLINVIEGIRANLPSYLFTH